MLTTVLAVLPLAAAACWGAVATAPADAAAVGWTAGAAAVLVTAAIGAAAHARTLAARDREGAERDQQEAQRLRRRLAAVEAETDRLADAVLPDLVGRVRGKASAGAALAAVERPVSESLRRVLRLVAEELYQERRLRSAAMAVCATSAGRVQALVTKQLADLREMQERHSDQRAVLADLFRLDHTASQMGRTANTLAVLTGSRSGRQWNRPIPMESVLRGAQSRISAYQRVRTHSSTSAAVVGSAAEAVMHSLAELLDNAARFSPPRTEVHVYVSENQRGLVVEVEDSGLAMGEEALGRAEQAVSASELDLTTLSGNRLGLQAVGCHARRHGLTVSFRPSSYGGTRVVMMIPPRLIAPVRTDTGHTASAAPAARVPSRPGPARPGRDGTAEDGPTASEDAPPATPSEPDTSAPASPEPAAEPKPAAQEAGTGGLPRRRRGQTLAAAEAAAAAAATPGRARTRPAAATEASTRRLGAFQQAIRKGRESAATPPRQEDHR